MPPPRTLVPLVRPGSHRARHSRDLPGQTPLPSTVSVVCGILVWHSFKVRRLDAGAARNVDPTKMTRWARRQAEKEEEARQEAARRRLREARTRRHNEDSEPPADPTVADCINMVRVLRRTHNAIEHEYNKLLDLQERTEQALAMSNEFTKIADINHASVERMFAWFTYHHQIDPEWSREEIWGKDPKARVFRSDKRGHVREVTDSEPLPNGVLKPK